jgi:hypothetical protein
MSKITVAKSPLTNTIYAGSVSKGGTSFLSDKTDVTSACLQAVIDFVGPGYCQTINVDGKPKYEITVKELNS